MIVEAVGLVMLGLTLITIISFYYLYQFAEGRYE